jgi:hypothetical protein
MKSLKPLLALVIFAAVAGAVGAAFATLADRQRGVTTTPAGPREILIIRHGEEPKDGPHLDDTGRARAKALVGLFRDPFSVPTSLFAAKSSKQSERSVETLEPLAKAIGAPIDSRFSDGEYKTLATTVLHGSPHAGGTIMISWHRETIRELAAALGVENPPDWPSSQYDHIWRISFAKDKRVIFTDEPMGLDIGRDQ